MTYVFAFFVVTGLIILAGRLRRRLGILLLVVAILSALLLGTPVVKTWMYLAYSSLAAFEDVGGTVSGIVKPGSGQDVLPDEVREVVSLIRAHHLDTYRLSFSLQIEKDPVVYMRTVEAVWPARLEPNSAYVFSRLTEGPPGIGCIRVDQGKDMALDYCP